MDDSNKRWRGRRIIITRFISGLTSMIYRRKRSDCRYDRKGKSPHITRRNSSVLDGTRARVWPLALRHQRISARTRLRQLPGL
jgi:hypothetical protein